MAEMKLEDEYSAKPAWELVHIKEDPESCIKREPEDFPFHIVTVKYEHDEDNDKTSVLHQRPEEEDCKDTIAEEFGTYADHEEHMNSSSDTDHSEDYTQDQALSKRSYAMIPPDSLASDLPPFSCSGCGKLFQEKSRLQRHELVHTEDRPFMCPACEQRFKYKDSLRKHLVFCKKYNDGPRPYLCPDCGKGFHEPSHVTQHQKSTHNVCPVCKARFSAQTELKLHLKSHEVGGTLQPGENPLTCSDCGKTYRDKWHLEQHMASHTGDTYSTCPVCDKGFRSRSYLPQHMELVHPICPFCKTRFMDKAFLKEHMKTHAEAEGLDSSEEGPFSCSECKRTFKNNSRMQRHMLVHTQERIHKCPACEKDFKYKDCLTKHLVFCRKTTEGDLRARPHKCPDCEERFSRKPFLILHLKTIHNACPVCETRFPDQTELAAHLKIHEEDGTLPNGDVPMTCAICEKTFKDKYQLKQHMKSHSGYRPYVCPLCHKGFKFRSHLPRHLQRHPKCPVCETHFLDKLYLKEHMKTHAEVADSDSGPCICSECGKTFRSSATLQCHIKLVHAREKPHKCTVCAKSYGQESALAQHYRDEHHPCVLCETLFVDEKSLQEHLMIHVEQGSLNTAGLKREIE